MAQMRNKAAWELTERHQSWVTRIEVLINELHSAGPSGDRGARGCGGGRQEMLSSERVCFPADENPLKTLSGMDLLWITLL